MIEAAGGPLPGVGLSEARITPVPTRWQRARLAAILAAAAGGAAMLYWFDPAPRGRQGIFPRCVIHEFTGLYCPACGATRACHALLHGHFLTATHFNPIVTLVAMPVLAWAVVRPGITAVFPQLRFNERHGLGLARSIGIGVIIFTILRNIPCRPFLYLAPP